MVDQTNKKEMTAEQDEQKILSIEKMKEEITVPKVEKKRVKRLPPIQETEKFILETVKGQNEQVRSVVTAAYRAIKFNHIKSNVLIIGKSGTGKTEIMRQLAKKLGRVFVTIDANEFTQEGYYGRDVSEIADDLLDAADGDLEEAERAIVFIDEIDKKAASAGVERDVSGRGVLNSLLKFIEGKTLKIPPISDEFGTYGEMLEFNTQHLIVFLAGAFDGIDEIAKKRLDTNRMGFSVNSQNNQTNTGIKYTKQDIIKFGFPEEFVGRIDTIVQMNELSEDVLVEILQNSKGSALKAYEKALKKQKIALKYDSALIRAIAKKATSTKTGARELSNVVNYIFEKVLYEVMAVSKGKYAECILLQGIEVDNTKYILR